MGGHKELVPALTTKDKAGFLSTLMVIGVLPLYLFL